MTRVQQHTSEEAQTVNGSEILNKREGGGVVERPRGGIKGRRQRKVVEAHIKETSKGLGV